MFYECDYSGHLIDSMICIFYFTFDFQSMANNRAIIAKIAQNFIRFPETSLIITWYLHKIVFLRRHAIVSRNFLCFRGERAQMPKAHVSSTLHVTQAASSGRRAWWGTCEDVGHFLVVNTFEGILPLRIASSLGTLRCILKFLTLISMPLNMIFKNIFHLTVSHGYMFVCFSQTFPDLYFSSHFSGLSKLPTNMFIYLIMFLLLQCLT